MSERAAAPSPAAAPGKHTKQALAAVRPDPGSGPVRDRGAQLRMSARAAVLLVVAMIVLTLGIAPLRTYLGQRSQLAELRRQSSELEVANARLEDRIDRLQDPEYLERLARQCLGMVRPGEVAFVTVPERGTPTPPRC